MDVIFLHSNELNWKFNYDRARYVLGSKIKLVDGSINASSSSSSLRGAYEKVFDAANTEYFMMIEADNWIYPETEHFLKFNEPTKFWTTNKFGISYEHGGIKIMHTESGRRQLKNNANIYDNFEISANLMLKTRPSILSAHNFDFSERNEWIVIAKELIKLHFWGHTDYLNRWLQHKLPAKIYEEDVLEMIKKDISFTSLFNTTLPSLGAYYDNKKSN